MNIANGYQEEADKWFALAKSYNDIIVSQWLEELKTDKKKEKLK
ncbi:MAG: hypothetical protein ACOC5T_05325 [Elusimicrobiota bacterium]